MDITFACILLLPSTTVYNDFVMYIMIMRTWSPSIVSILNSDSLYFAALRSFINNNYHSYNYIIILCYYYYVYTPVIMLVYNTLEN